MKTYKELEVKLERNVQRRRSLESLWLEVIFSQGSLEQSRGVLRTDQERSWDVNSQKYSERFASRGGSARKGSGEAWGIRSSQVYPISRPGSKH
jgi:hypothetical protein